MLDSPIIEVGLHNNVGETAGNSMFFYILHIQFLTLFHEYYLSANGKKRTRQYIHN